MPCFLMNYSLEAGSSALYSVEHVHVALKSVNTASLLYSTWKATAAMFVLMAKLTTAERKSLL